MKDKLKIAVVYLIGIPLIIGIGWGLVAWLKSFPYREQGPRTERAEERFITLSNMVMQLNRNQFTLAQIVSNRTTMQTQTVVVTNWFPLPGMGEDYGYTPEQSQKAETLLILPDTNGIKHAVPVLPVEPSEVQE